MFPERMLLLMKEKKITKRQISTDLNFGINQIKYWEKNNNIPGADVLHEIALYLGTSVEYLIEESEEKEPINVGSDEENAAFLLDLAQQTKNLTGEERAELKNYVEYLISKRKKG